MEARKVPSRAPRVSPDRAAGCGGGSPCGGARHPGGRGARRDPRLPALGDRGGGLRSPADTRPAHRGMADGSARRRRRRARLPNPARRERRIVPGRHAAGQRGARHSHRADPAPRRGRAPSVSQIALADAPIFTLEIGTSALLAALASTAVSAIPAWVPWLMLLGAGAVLAGLRFAHHHFRQHRLAAGLGVLALLGSQPAGPRRWGLHLHGSAPDLARPRRLRSAVGPHRHCARTLLDGRDRAASDRGRHGPDRDSRRARGHGPGRRHRGRDGCGHFDRSGGRDLRGPLLDLEDHPPRPRSPSWPKSCLCERPSERPNSTSLPDVHKRLTRSSSVVTP